VAGTEVLLLSFAFSLATLLQFVLLLVWAATQGGAGGYFSSPLWSMAAFLAVFALVLTHEFGHALACRSVGGQANRIVLWPLGGVAFVQPPPRPGAVLWSIAAGPLVNVVLAPLLLVLAMVADMYGRNGLPADLVDLAYAAFAINLILLIFNILPIYPLDGGQIVQAMLWFFIGYARSLRATAAVGFVVAVIGGAVALYHREVWFVLLALFIGFRAYHGYRVACAIAAMQRRQSYLEHPYADSSG
jgi:Zn-dependent protease